MNKFKNLREKYRSKFPPSLVAAAVKIALDMGGAMTPAVKKIERMKKGLSDDPIVADALRQANESVKEGTVQEGTWEIPQTKAELKKLVDMLQTPFPATKPADLTKFLNAFPIGDDQLYDAIDSVEYEKDSEGKVIRPLKKLKSWPKVFLNVIAGEALNGEWIKGKTQGNKFIATHHYFSLDEAMVKRKAGKFRPKKMQRIEL